MNIINEIFSILGSIWTSTGWFTFIIIALWVYGVVHFARKHNNLLTSLLIGVGTGCLVWSASFIGTIAVGQYMLSNPSLVVFTALDTEAQFLEVVSRNHARDAKQVYAIFLCGITLLGLAKKPWRSLLKSAKSTEHRYDDLLVVVGAILGTIPFCLMVFGPTFTWWIKGITIVYTYFCLWPTTSKSGWYRYQVGPSS